jgi:hypothetical protein
MMSRPGFRHGGRDLNDAKAARDAAYDEMEQATANAWRQIGHSSNLVLFHRLNPGA